MNDIIDDNITELYSRVNQNELDLTENKAAISVNADHITDIETESKTVFISN